jgi:hypothetical protein
MVASPWADPIPDPQEGSLTPAEVTLTAWIETTCEAKFGQLIHCDFQWFGAAGELNDPVDTGHVNAWERLSTADATSAGERTTETTQATGGVVDGAADKEDGGGDAGVETAVRSRFERTSPPVQAKCGFIRLLADASLCVRVRFQDPSTLSADGLSRMSE